MRRLLVDQLLHRLLLALRVEAPHVEGDQLQLLPSLSLLMFLMLVVRDFFLFFIPLLLVLFLFPPFLFPSIQLLCKITIIAWTGSRVSHSVGSWWRFPVVTCPSITTIFMVVRTALRCCYLIFSLKFLFPLVHLLDVLGKFLLYLVCFCNVIRLQLLLPTLLLRFLCL